MSFKPLQVSVRWAQASLTLTAMSILNLVSRRVYVPLLRVLAVIASTALLLPLALADAPPASALERARTSWVYGDFESGGAVQPPGWTVNATAGDVRAAASTSRAISGSRSLQVDDGLSPAEWWALR